MAKLTALTVKNLSEPGRYGDGDTLFLVVGDTGRKTWLQRITINGRRCDIGLGSWPVTTLERARRKAFENRVLVSEGKDPLAEKRKELCPTFEEASKRYYEENLPTWKEGKSASVWLNVLRVYAFPKFGKIRVNRLTREDVLKTLIPVWTKKPEMARKLRQRIRVVLQWCQAHGYVDLNVAGEVIEGALPSMPSVNAHHRALPYEELATALDTIEGSGSALSVKLCLRFVIVTVCRSVEARGATWAEIDAEKQVWTIPPERMKTKREHNVPLSSEALRVLEQAKGLRDKSDLLFPSPARKGKPLSDMAMWRLLDNTGLAEKCVVHGFRTTFRVWAEEQTSFDYAVKEQALAHAVGSSVERSYSRSDLLQKRRVLMEQWSRYVTGEGQAKVIPLHG